MRSGLEDANKLTGMGGPLDPAMCFVPSELVEAVLGLLEDAGVPSDLNDKIVVIIEEWQDSHEYGSAAWQEEVINNNIAEQQ